MSQLTPKTLQIDGSDFRIGIVAARYNEIYVDGLVARAKEALLRASVSEERILVERAPGSVELPLAAQWLAETNDYDAIIALGVVIAGGTRHDEMVADSSNYGLQKVALETGVPIINGIIVGKDEEQVKERCIGEMNKGQEFGQCALEMASLRRKYRPS